MTQTIAVSDLVVGDVFKIEQGMRVPSDSILLDGIDVRTDESATKTTKATLILSFSVRVSLLQEWVPLWYCV